MNKLQRWILIFGFLTLFLNCYGKKQLRIVEDSLFSYKIDTISEELFTSITSSLQEERPNYNTASTNDSLINLLESFDVLDSCIVIPRNDESIKICRRKGFCYKCGEHYRILDKKCGTLIIVKSWYEGGEYFLVEFLNEKFYQFNSEPIFINCDYAYSYLNYYGEGVFTLYDLISYQKLELLTNNCPLNKCFRQENNFYFSFTPYKKSPIFIHLQFQ